MYALYQREDVDQTPGVVFTIHPQPGTSDQSSYDMFLPLPSYTRLKEYLWSDSDSPHSNWKTCEHYKCSSVAGSGTQSVETSCNHVQLGEFHVGVVKSPSAFYDTAFGNAGESNSGLPAFIVQRADGGFVPPPADLDALLQRGLNSMMPRIKAELSIVNSLIELKDFLTLRSTISKVRDFVVNTNFSKVRYSKKTLSGLFRTKADVYLQYKFNIAPLLSDISGIYRSIANTEKRLNAFIARSGRVRLSHFTTSLTESVDEPSPIAERAGFDVRSYPAFDSSYSCPLVVRSERHHKTEPASFHMQVQYNYNYTGYQLEHARLLSHLDALGLNLNPQIIWNAIPWSFVVDWIFGVGRYLSDQRFGSMDPKINILRCLWSIRRERRINVYGTTSYKRSFLLPDMSSVTSHARPVVVETAYRRQPFLPSSSSLLVSGLSSTEFSLGAALIVSRRRRPKRLRS